MRYIILIFLNFTFSFLYSQNEIIVNQYSQNVFALNSSYSSIAEKGEANLYYKKLWSGFYDSPEFSQLTLYCPIKNKKTGIGLNAAYQQIGLFSYLNAQGSFSYKLKLNDINFLSFGLQAGIKRLQINFSKINAYDPDEFFDFPQMQGSTIPTADFSVSYKRKTLLVFASANQLLAGKFKYNDATYQPTLKSQIIPYYLIGLKWDKALSNKLNNSVSLITRSHQGLPIQVEISDAVTWQHKVSIGVGYRQTYSAYALARFQLTPDLSGGYSYEYNINKLNKYTNGGHEINICYQLSRSNNKEEEPQNKLSNKNITNIYEQLAIVNEKLEQDNNRIDSLNADVEELRDEINILKTQNLNQEEIKYFMDSVKNAGVTSKTDAIKNGTKKPVQKSTKKKKTKWSLFKKNKSIRPPDKNKERQALANKNKASAAAKKSKIKAIGQDTMETDENSEAYNLSIEFAVKDNKTLKLINSKITVTELATKETALFTNNSIGSWKGTIKKDKKYKLLCTSIGYNNLEINIDSSKGKSIDVLLQAMKAGDNFIMKNIYFHPNSFASKVESDEELKRLLDYLIENPEINIEIQGHTNGDKKIHKNKKFKDLGEEWNFRGTSKKLSAHRAETIKNYLIINGVSAERLTTKGMGGSKPIIEKPETMAEGEKNIRVEIVILKN